MPEPLPRLRMDLDFMPSPAPDRPGLLIRDPRQYSDATLIVPPQLVESLQFFDGQATDLDLRAQLARLTGSVQVGDLMEHLISTLRKAGFLQDEVYARLRDERHRGFAEAPYRAATHAGGAYPDEPAALSATLAAWIDEAPAAPAADGLLGVAAPHVSPAGGRKMYGAAYRALGADLRDRVFVILGTSHYGAPDRFGLTRKPFVTPLGEARTEAGLAGWLADRAREAVEMEDYCHHTEHSIEFQVVFLQHLFGPRVSILPILCGPYTRGLLDDGRPEDAPPVRRFLDALAQLAATDPRLFWVLGVDMAHMGRRYGDPFPAVANAGPMARVAERDRARINAINGGDADGLWALVRENQDDLKWCGSSVFYTFLKAVPRARGRLLGYEQWNIDDQSVVSYGALEFAAA